MSNSLQRRVSMALAVVLLSAALARAQTFTTLYSFTGRSDGSYPVAGVIQDSAGNLYGTASWGGGGAGGDAVGVVYSVNATGTENVLYTFCSRTNCTDGANPEAPVIRDKAGNIYGTSGGGSANCTEGCGVVFKIDTAGNETVLHKFTGGSDGCYPYQGLIAGKSGALYGTTSFCGSGGYGTIFKVDSARSFAVLHSFTGTSSDGATPYYGHLEMDRSGNFYGVTYGGGASGFGTLYKLSRSGRFTLLHSFGGYPGGCEPYGSVVQDEAGNLYGTTSSCGSSDGGTIWKVSKKGKETILHNFAGGSGDGCDPLAGVVRDSKGNLYGVTYGCGANGWGAFYELSASGRLTLLHSFDDSDGANPLGEVLRTRKGVMFGTTYAYQSDAGWGTVWSYVP